MTPAAHAGLESCTDTWDGVMERLAAQQPPAPAALAVDLRGHGLTDPVRIHTLFKKRRLRVTTYRVPAHPCSTFNFFFHSFNNFQVMV